MSRSAATLSTLPPELLEHIAQRTWDHVESLSPYSDLLSLSMTKKAFAARLLPSNNPLLHARIFQCTFDTAALRRRLPASQLTAENFCCELRRRFGAMSRFRSKPTTEDMWIVLLMLLENESRNISVLHFHARVKFQSKKLLDGLMVEFRARTGRRLDHRPGQGRVEWPPATREVNLLMWILWLAAGEDDKKQNLQAMLVLKLMSPYVLSGFRYPLSMVSWTAFRRNIPLETVRPDSVVQYFGRPLSLFDPEFIPGATLNFMLRLNMELPTLPPLRAGSLPWDTEWRRMTAVGKEVIARPGQLGGVWEGVFLFMEFTSYLQLLHGADQRALEQAYIGKHQQVWKLREYVYSGSDPIPDGDPLMGHLPSDAVYNEGPNGLEISVPGHAPWIYRAYDPLREEQGDSDIVVLGEGHSSWGGFVLRGRVRPYDGLVTLVKQYASRGLWLYRGFVVGGSQGHFVGRWRDSESDIAQNGYEGCFVLGRRRAE